MSTVKRKLKRKCSIVKEDLSNDSVSSVRKKFRKLKPKFERKNNKRKEKKSFKRRKCEHVDSEGKRCNCAALGSSNVCRKHGAPIGTLAIPYKKTSRSIKQMTKFRPNFHPMQFISMSREGMSDVEIAGSFGVAKDTLLNWAETFEEFAMAYEVGKSLEEAYYIRDGRHNLNNCRYNTSLFKFMTGNRLGYSDKIESRNFNMNVSGVLKIPNKMTESEWEDADFTVKEESDE